MTYAYDEMYIEGAMIRLGDMLEYACLDVHLDPDCFWKMFIESDVSHHFEIGNVSYIAGQSGVELAYKVLSEIDNMTSFPDALWREERSDIFWCGWILAYYQWYSNQSFHKIWEYVSIRQLLKLYPTFHEADISKTIQILDTMKHSIPKNKVSTLRLIKGMTQVELANKAKMSVSQLQRLEYGERKVENLSLKTALRLADALNVRVEELE
jgi:DNA-binding XRE family transcriptional regulator